MYKIPTKIPQLILEFTMQDMNKSKNNNGHDQGFEKKSGSEKVE